MAPASARWFGTKDAACSSTVATPAAAGLDLTTADGVAFSTRRVWCGAGFACAAVDGVAPAMAVETTSAITPTTTRYLDKLGRVARVETEAFTGAHGAREDVRRDARDRALRRSAPHFANAAAPNTSYEYDILDRVTRETRPDGGETTRAYAAGTGGKTTETVVEKVYVGSTLSATLTTVNTYNLMGEVAGVTEASGTTAASTTAYSYDASGLLLTATANGVTAATFAYDAAGNRTSSTRPDSGTETFTHTALGQTLTWRNALGQTTTLGYDLLGRRTSRSEPDGKSYWTWDPANGKGMLHRRCRGAATLSSCAGTPGFSETLAYGTDARVSSATTVIRADGQAARTYVHRFHHDASGRLSRVEHPSGVTARREYNSRGYLSRVLDHSTSGALATYTAEDAFGSVTGETHGNGFATARTFDANTGRQTGVETTRGSGAAKTVAQDFGYVWRSDGALRSRSTGSGAARRTETFGHDALRRLTSATASGAGGRSLTYGYDALGNLLNRTSSATADADVALSGHLSTATAAPGPHAPRFATVGTERRGLAYDAAGRLTSATVCAASSGACAAKSGADHRFVTWNARGEAERVLVGGSATDATPEAREDFARGPDGGLYFRKSAWREDGAERVERRYVVGGFEDVVPASPMARFERVRKTRVTDTVLHVRKKPRGGAEVSSFEYLHRDHLGSVTALTDAARAVSRQAAHDPFGARRASDWARAQTAAERAAWADDADARTTEGFSAHRQLDRTGLVDMGGRLYDPELGLFLSPDPLVAEPASSQGWNPYSYVGNRPLSRVDPSGFSIAPTGCNLGDTACLRRRASGGWGGFTPAPAWSVSVRLGIRWLVRLNFGFDIDLGWRSWVTRQPVVVMNINADLESAGVERAPADEPLFTWRDALSFGVGFIPLVGSLQSVVELIIGRDPITGEDVDRRLAAVGVVAGLVPGGKPLLKTGTTVATVIERRGQRVGVAVNRAKGLASEARVLKELGLTKNTQRVHGKEGYSIPDALTDTELIEIKDTARVVSSRQARIQSQAARAMGLRSILYVGKNTVVSARVRALYDEVTPYPGLGPP